MAAKKKQSPATISAGGEPHVIYAKGKKIIVDHLGKTKGKNDKINLTQVAGAKTVKEGVAATKGWHSKNPHKKAK
jgi:hypothetical protein